ALLHNGPMEPNEMPAHAARVLDRLRRARLWLLFVLGGLAIALFPWTAYLSATLPSEHVTHHWQVAWAGFDLFEASALVATAVEPLDLEEGLCDQQGPAGDALRPPAGTVDETGKGGEVQ